MVQIALGYLEIGESSESHVERANGCCSGHAKGHIMAGANSLGFGLWQFLKP